MSARWNVKVLDGVADWPNMATGFRERRRGGATRDNYRHTGHMSRSRQPETNHWRDRIFSIDTCTNSQPGSIRQERFTVWMF